MVVQRLDVAQDLAGFFELLFLGRAVYPYVIALMAASALVPMFCFRGRGWLQG